MRHWVLGDILGIDGLAIEEAFSPDPGDNEVLINVRAAALNFSDLLINRNIHWIILRFTYGWRLLSGLMLRMRRKCVILMSLKSFGNWDIVSLDEDSLIS